MSAETTPQFNFEDIEPVKLNEEQPQLCQILYSDEYKQTMGTLLALLRKKEYSERALHLTQQGIELLASHYTIWNYRFNILVNLKKDLFDELDWCEVIALENEKNYQIWNYRQLVIEQIVSSDESISDKFDPHREYPILNAMLQEDLKNHHVWSYRKWLVAKFGLFDDSRELGFVDKCIDLDIRNNSAWTHRFFIFMHRLDASNDKAHLVESEINYTKEKILVIPQNPSPWNFLLGIYRKLNMPLADLQDFCQQLANTDEEVTIKSSFALEVLAKIYAEKSQIDKAGRTYDLLAEKYDPIRSNYWNYEKSKLVQQNC